MDNNKQYIDDINNKIDILNNQKIDFSKGTAIYLVFLLCLIIESIFLSPAFFPLAFIDFIHMMGLTKHFHYTDYEINRLEGQKSYAEEQNKYSSSLVDGEERLNKLKYDKADLLGSFIGGKLKMFLRIIIILGSSLFISKSFIFLIISFITSLVYATGILEEIDLREKIEEINLKINNLEYGMEINAQKEIEQMISTVSDDLDKTEELKIPIELSLDNEKLVDDYLNSLDGMESVEKDKEKTKRK